MARFEFAGEMPNAGSRGPFKTGTRAEANAPARVGFAVANSKDGTKAPCSQVTKKRDANPPAAIEQSAFREIDGLTDAEFLSAASAALDEWHCATGD